MSAWKSRNAFTAKGLDVKKVVYIIVIAVGVIALLKNGLTYFNARSHRDALKAEIEELKVKNIEEEKKIKDIYNDREFVEKKAREDLGMVKDGETVIKIKK
jgi:cell division protein FtsB